MSFAQDSSPWPSASRSSASPQQSPANYFPSLDPDTLTPSISSTYSPHASIHINPGSELPRHASTSASPPLQPRSRKNTTEGRSTRTTSMSVPLTASSKVVKSTPQPLIKPEMVWREILKTAYGRDKAFKIIQYSMKLYLLAHAKSLALFRQPRGGEVVRRMNLSISHFSLTRKCLILFNWLTPLIHITSPSETSVPFASSAANLSSPTLMHRFLHAPPPVLLDLLNAVFDDVSTLSRLGIVGTGVGRRAGRLADWFWFASTLAGLVEVGAERAMVKGMLSELEGRIYEAEMEKSMDLSRIDEDEEELRKLKAQYSWLKVLRTKLIMDLIFVSYEVFRLKRAREPVMTISGLCAALLSTYKMYDSQRGELVKSST